MKSFKANAEQTVIGRCASAPLVPLYSLINIFDEPSQPQSLLSASVKAFGCGALVISPSTILSESNKLRVLLGCTVDLSIVTLHCVLDATLLEKFVCRL